MAKQHKDVATSVKLTPEMNEKLLAIMSHWNTDKSDAIRMSITAMFESLSARPMPSEVGLLGSDEEVKAKWKIIEAAGQHKGLSLAAYEAGVTMATAERWGNEDPLFGQLFGEALNRATDMAAHKLWYNGVHDGHTKSLLGYLAANHPDYLGSAHERRTARQFERYTTKLAKILHNYLTHVQVRSFIEEFTMALGIEEGVVIEPPSDPQEDSLVRPRPILMSPSDSDEDYGAT